MDAWLLVGGIISLVAVFIITNESMGKNLSEIFKDEIQSQIGDEISSHSIESAELLADQACKSNSKACGPTNTVLAVLYTLAIMPIVVPLLMNLGYRLN